MKTRKITIPQNDTDPRFLYVQWNLLSLFSILIKNLYPILCNGKLLFQAFWRQSKDVSAKVMKAILIYRVLWVSTLLTYCHYKWNPITCLFRKYSPNDYRRSKAVYMESRNTSSIGLGIDWTADALLSLHTWACLVYLGAFIWTLSGFCGVDGYARAFLNHWGKKGWNKSHHIFKK